MKEMRWHYGHGREPEIVYDLGPGDMTVEEAKDEALVQVPEGDVTISRGLHIWPDRNQAINVDLMLDDYLTNNEEAFYDGEFNFDCRKEHELELEEMLRATFTCWLQRHGWVIPGSGIEFDYRTEVYIEEQE